MNRVLKVFHSYNGCNYMRKLFTNELKVLNKTQFNRSYGFLVKNDNQLNITSKQLSLPSIALSKHYSTAKTETKAKPLNTLSDNEVQSSKSKKRIPRKRAMVDVNADTLSPILAFSTAEEYDFEELADGLKGQGLYDLMPFDGETDDVLHFRAKYEINNIRREFFVFRHGSIVCWNMPFVECEAILKFIKQYEDNPYDQSIVDEEQEIMHYQLVTTKSRLQKGLIHLTNNNKGIETDLERYTFSDAIALSVKLAIWESLMDRYIQSIEFVSQDMKESKLKLSRDQVFRKTGELFDLKHRINLSSDLLDTPDFYWDRQELERLFVDTIYFLNIKKRTNVLNEKLNHCIELMELLSNNLNHSHSAKLEWMIIVLIVVEVVFEAIHYAQR